jgi:hypothetical protein
MSEALPRPMKRCSPPAYPTKLEVLFDRKLLATNMPPNWVSRAEVAGLAAAFLVAGADGCSKKPATLGPNDRAIVAPLFEHGDGRGATGCIVTAPPVFLSEEEALEVIREELTGMGLIITDENLKIESVCVPQRIWDLKANWLTGDWDITTSVNQHSSIPFHADLVDAPGKVVVEFVSAWDLEDLIRSGSFWSSVETYDLKTAAGWLQDSVRKQGHGFRFGAFYDPLLPIDWRLLAGDDEGTFESRLEASRSEITSESKRLLREQVRDFVEWLKGQGAI